MNLTYVYIVAEDAFSSAVKIGISSDPEKRAAQHRTAWIGHKPPRLIHTVRCASRETAREVERGALKRLQLSGVKTRQELAWCSPAVAYGHLRLAWESANHQTYEELQYDLFAA